MAARLPLHDTGCCASCWGIQIHPARSPHQKGGSSSVSKCNLPLQAYEAMMFGQAVQAGYYVLQNARDEYRLACGPAGMHQGLVQDYLRVRLWLAVPQSYCRTQFEAGSILPLRPEGACANKCHQSVASACSV